MSDTNVSSPAAGNATAPVLERLVDALPELSPQLRKAAQYVLDHPNDVGVGSIGDMAASTIGNIEALFSETTAAEVRAAADRIEHLRPVASAPVEEACNWKVSIENYNECYHCRLNHPTFANGVIDPSRYDVTPHGYCLRHAGRAAPAAKMTYDVDPRVGAHATDYGAWFLWPAFSFQVYPGSLINTYLWRPSGVAATTVHRGWYAVDGEASDTILALARQDRETTVAEDLRLVESVQRGLGSRGYRPGPLVIDPARGVNSEHSVHALHRWLLEALAD